jgi:hypothetical protein
MDSERAFYMQAAAEAIPAPDSSFDAVRIKPEPAHQKLFHAHAAHIAPHPRFQSISACKFQD